MIRLERLAVSYGGVRALDGLTIELEPGRVYGLIGPNGAGKSTAVNVITGVTRAASGRIFIGDRDVTGAPAHARARAGMARTFQNLALFQSLTVRENIATGALHHGRGTAAVDEALRAFNLVEYQYDLTQALSLGIRKRVELARALISDPRLLLLDEPAAGLTPEDMSDLTGRVRQLRNSGGTVLIVEHNMPLVMSLCEYVFVLEFGQLIAQGTPKEVKENARVQSAYFGSEHEV